MNIGELACATDTKPETIRYYEQIGLLPEPPRTAGNYRDYAAEHVNSLTLPAGRASSVFRSSRSARCSRSRTRRNNPATL
jgi:hypothetical protein